MPSATAAATGLLVAFLFVGATLVAGGAVAVVQIVRVSRLANAGTLRDGLVSLSGRATPLAESEPVTSPLTGRSALCYAFEVRRVESGPDRRGRDEPRTGRGGVPFVLATGDGCVLVDPAGADLALDPTVDATVDADEYGELGSACESVRVDESGDLLRVGDVDLPADGRYRVVERRLEPGDALSVTGPATTDPADGAIADAGDGSRAGVDALIRARQNPGVLGRSLRVPFVVGASGIDRPRRQLADRAIAGLVFGLPLVGLSLALLFPPSGL